MSSESLQQELDKLRLEGEKRRPELFATVKTANQQIYETGILEKALKVGNTAPDFALPNAYGLPVRLSDLLKRGSVVLSFYRGDWCPYCNLSLRAYQSILPDLLKLNAALVAISPQSPKHAFGISAKHNLSYQVLSDVDNQVARQYRLVYEMPEVLRLTYLAMGHDMLQQHGSWELPLPATLIIDSQAIIRYMFLAIDYTKRAEPAEILSVVRSL